MIKSVEFGDKLFASKSELFKALKDNREKLIELKKAAVKNSSGLSFNHFEHNGSELKALSMEDGYIYPVINTTKYMDSHNDVHIDGIWNKSVKEQQGKIFYIADHNLSLPTVIAFPKDVEMMLETMPFSELGSNLNGNTQALIFKVSKDAIQMKEASRVIEDKIPIEHSVRMQYVTLFLAVNSVEDGYKEEKANWDTYFPMIANKEVAEGRGYFWAVTEAKIYKEGSMVLAGSNDITPLLQKDIEPLENTQEKDEPLKDTHKKRIPNGVRTIFY